MGDGLEPTETSNGTITVRLLDDTAGTRQIQCSSFTEAIDKVRVHEQTVTAVKIIDRDDDVVFTSREMDIDDWVVQWDHAKRRLGVDVAEHHCPYDTISCFADD